MQPDRDSMEMVEGTINDRYKIMMPQARALRPEWKMENGGWEVKRIEAMLAAIKESDIVFDVGCEEAEMSALLQKETGCNMVLFEPNDRVWPCVKAVWEVNNLRPPLDLYRGFISDKTTGEIKPPLDNPFEGIDWPMIHGHGFKQLYENYPDVPQITLDDYCYKNNVFPDVITMDCEGSEFQIIKGAEKVLKEHRPTIFMSIHPDFMFESYKHEGKWKDLFGDDKQRVVHLLRFIDEIGYKHEIIEWDWHECHAAFYPK